MGKILSISLKLNFTLNTLGCYGLISVKVSVTEKIPVRQPKRMNKAVIIYRSNLKSWTEFIQVEVQTGSRNCNASRCVETHDLGSGQQLTSVGCNLWTGHCSKLLTILCLACVKAQRSTLSRIPRVLRALVRLSSSSSLE